MSSVVLWNCPLTGVTASWNKEGPKYTCFVPAGEVPGCPGVVDGITTAFTTEEAAIEAAKREAAAMRDRQQEDSEPS